MKMARQKGEFMCAAPIETHKEVPQAEALSRGDKAGLKNKILADLWTRVHGTSPSPNLPDLHPVSIGKFIQNAGSLVLTGAFAGLQNLADLVLRNSLDKAFAEGDVATAARLLLKGEPVTPHTEQMLKIYSQGKFVDMSKFSQLESLLKLAKAKTDNESSLLHVAISSRPTPAPFSFLLTPEPTSMQPINREKRLSIGLVLKILAILRP